MNSTFIALASASHGDTYRVRTMDVNTAVDDFDAVIANHGSGLRAKV